MFRDVANTTDYRDGQWHVGSGIFDWGAQTIKARINGGQELSLSTWAGGGTVRRDITTVGGGNRLRVGAAGFADQPSEYRFVGDIGEIFISAAPLAGSALTDIENAIKGRYGLA